MAFMLGIPFFKLVEHVIIAEMTTILEGSASVFDKRTLFGKGDEELLLW